MSRGDIGDAIWPEWRRRAEDEWKRVHSTVPTPAEGGADAYVLALCSKDPNLLIPHWLIASFMYYVEDSPILSDAAFDKIVERLGSEWDSLTHPHKHLLDPTLLKSGFYLTSYPEIVKGAAAQLRLDLRKGKHGVH